MVPDVEDANKVLTSSSTSNTTRNIHLISYELQLMWEKWIPGIARSIGAVTNEEPEGEIC